MYRLRCSGGTKATRFYLHIHDRNRTLRDRDGVGCADLSVARRLAFEIVEELIGDGAWPPNSNSGRHVAIEDSKGQVVARVMLWEVVEHIRR